MTSPVERVRGLVRAGTIAPEEGERLIAALDVPSRPNHALLVFNPFERFGGAAAAMAGLVVAALSVGITRFGVHFDGFLDLHLAPPQSLLAAVREQAIAWFMPAALFWAYARAMVKHVRLLDFVGVIGLARIPLLLSAVLFVALEPLVHSPNAKLFEAVVIALPSIAWHVTLLYQGFKNASGLGGAKLIAGFIALVAVAETVSKVVLSSFR